ncbi:hypothetical protein ACQR16_06010 [Bradyrhizobium oligotrophicum]|uniref:hypothetical protein n=1 Tax=Bradyrhizobium oligotrophicum TaxID=44255 RepID=UPI003EBB4137
MTDDHALIDLDEAAKLIPGADAGTLKRMHRAGKLVCYRPGKKLLTTAANVMEAVKVNCRVAKPSRGPERSPAVPNSLGLTESDLASICLEQILDGKLREHKERRRVEKDEREKAYATREVAEPPPRKRGQRRT